MKTWILVLLLLFVILVAISIYKQTQEGFQNASIASCKGDSSCQAQATAVSDLADTRANAGTCVQAIEDFKMADDETCLANFYTLSCRFAGYVGPFQNGYFAPESAVQSALRMGCRTFVYEIDYFGELCDYYPRLVVRNASAISKSVNNKETDCNNDQISNLLDTSTAIAQNAFKKSDDPIIIVLYVLRVPPQTNGMSAEAYTKRLLQYYSRIAKSLAPLLPYDVSTTIDGNYYRQMNESKLLKNNIEHYQRKVLFFSNAQTEIFRSVTTPVPTNLDLDYIVNLRLTSNQTTFGVTAKTNPNSNSAKFGILDSVEDYMAIPDANIVSTEKTITNGTWTLCLTKDPSAIVPQGTADVLQKKFGIHSIPIQIWSPGYDYMFTEKFFKKYSYVPKPPPLRVPMPGIVIPAPAAIQTDSNHGILKPPTV